MQNEIAQILLRECFQTRCLIFRMTYKNVVLMKLEEIIFAYLLYTVYIIIYHGRLYLHFCPSS